MQKLLLFFVLLASAPEAKAMLDRFRSLIEDAVAKGFQVELVCD